MSIPHQYELGECLVFFFIAHSPLPLADTMKTVASIYSIMLANGQTFQSHSSANDMEIPLELLKTIFQLETILATRSWATSSVPRYHLKSLYGLQTYYYRAHKFVQNL